VLLGLDLSRLDVYFFFFYKCCYRNAFTLFPLEPTVVHSLPSSFGIIKYYNLLLRAGNNVSDVLQFACQMHVGMSVKFEDLSEG
jgi:hypothetical protein